jgi:predicted transposase YdaD
MSEQDSVWKEAIKSYFKEFMEFFFPEIAGDIAFDKGYEFLDKELERIVQDAEIGKRLADVLVKVYLRNGEEMWLIIHIEVQGYPEEGFEERMYIYNYRIFDRYRKPVVSLAVLTDPVKSFRPGRYERVYWGFGIKFWFPVVKVIDYRERWEELEGSKNPFAVIVMAHLKEMETKGRVDERLFWKITLVKRLYEKGYSKEDVLLLYKFIDWLVSLPEELAERFHEEIKKYEEVRKVAYITTAEKIGMKKGFEQGLQEGMQQGIQQGLQQGIQQGIQRGLLKAIELGLKLKFGVEGLRIYPEIKKIEDVDVLEAISEAIETAQSIEDIRKIYKEN